MMNWSEMAISLEEKTISRSSKWMMMLYWIILMMINIMLSKSRLHESLIKVSLRELSRNNTSIAKAMII